MNPRFLQPGVQRTAYFMLPSLLQTGYSGAYYVARVCVKGNVFTPPPFTPTLTYFRCPVNKPYLPARLFGQHGRRDMSLQKAVFTTPPPDGFIPQRYCFGAHLPLTASSAACTPGLRPRHFCSSTASAFLPRLLLKQPGLLLSLLRFGQRPER